MTMQSQQCTNLPDKVKGMLILRHFKDVPTQAKGIQFTKLRIGK